ncbi:magnesium transporter CorA family protein [Maritimibacter sp. HL-12]|jgi:magnesium transporter|uniref:magnesium transporter CorA family protein n=1 Tax=Maritimibacter sp. HL-12 TaxID=1162418 RepID=UPI000A0F0AD9|nr:magnesium transporter CorA family protein [Maritimibacter sp. HL-12]SMH53562.1 magnesium transporter [Maritimibacter sp. HL-12]
MLQAYRISAGRLTRLAEDEALARAVWIDLCAPDPGQVAEVEALGVAVPTRDDMEAIELSARLYREAGVDYMTVVLPGMTPEGVPVLAPVTFILDGTRLVTVRHHAPRPFEAFPARTGRGPLETADAAGVFLGLAEQIIARFADILEEIGSALDALSARVFTDGHAAARGSLRGALTTIGRVGDRVGRVRLGLLTMERALSFYGQTLHEGAGDAPRASVVAALQRDIAALAEHADFVYARIGLVDDATLGMIGLEQNAALRIFSVVAVLFMPPTLVASVYGMNFAAMPELGQPWGYPVALALMLASAALTYLIFKWKKWL